MYENPATVVCRLAEIGSLELVNMQECIQLRSDFGDRRLEV